MGEVAFFQNADIPSEDKNQRGYALFSMNNAFCQVRESQYEQILPGLCRAIQDTTKRTYLQYKNIDVMQPICEYFYQPNKRFYPDPDQENDVRGDFLLQFTSDRNVIFTGKYRRELGDHFFAWFERETDYQRKSNIFETLTRYYRDDPRMEAVDQQRYQRRVVEPEPWGGGVAEPGNIIVRPRVGHQLNNVHGDDQNVHNSTINHSVNDILQTLQRKYYRFQVIPEDFLPIQEHFTRDLYRICQDDWFMTVDDVIQQISPFLKDRFRKDWHNVLHNRLAYISDDRKIKWIEAHSFFARFPTVRTILDKCKIDRLLYGGVNLLQAFYLTLSYIYFSTQNELQGDTLAIYREEMEAMKNFCGTGHVARWVAALQGIPDLPQELQLEMSRLDALIAKISHELSKRLETASDEVVDGSVDLNTAYQKFVFDLVEEIAKEEKLAKDYFLPILEKIFGMDCVVEDGNWKLISKLKIVAQEDDDEHFRYL